MSKLSRLTWQCRRGSLELDLLLKNYLETSYLSSSESEKSRFEELLNLDDNDLLAIMQTANKGDLTVNKKI